MNNDFFFLCIFVCLGAMSVSCGSVQLGHPHMGHYLEDDDHDVVLHQHQQAGYRSLPHKSQQLRVHDGGLEGHGTTERGSRGGHYNPAQAQTTAGQAVPSTHNSFVVYPNYSSTVSTPRMRPQQNSLRGSLEAVQLAAAAAEAGHGQPMAEFSIASDNLHSEVDSRSTVIEQRRPSNARSVNSIQSGSVTVDDAGFLVVQGVGGPVAHAMVETDSLGHHPDLIGDHIDGGHASSEDNLSHDSYELIETKMLGNIREMTPEQHQAQQERKTSTGSAGVIPATGVGGGPSANQFEQEFYRQAAQASSKAKNGGTTAGSSRTSSRCSLNMSSSNMFPQVMPRDEVVKVALEQGISPAGNSNSMSRVKSQDSFSQASNHNRNNQNQDSLTSLVRSTNADPLNNNNQVIDENSQPSAPRGHREPTVIQVPELKEESRLMVDIVRAGRGRGAYISKNEVYSHSLPRSNADIMYHHQQQQQQQQHQQQLHGGQQHQHQQVQQQQHQQHQQHSRTLPSRRRERSPVYYSRSRIMSGGHGGPGGHPGECSSGSSSSHASPQIARPKSLEFAVVNVSALPNKQAFAYHDDSLELHHVPVSSRYGMEPPQPKPRLHLTKPQIPQSDLYDDSSSAMNEQLSSSDVPQTPENPNVTFLPLEAGPVIVGTCHQGIVRKQYYTTEERIYDVPEGIEGVSIPIKVITSQPPQVDVQDIVSPSTSSEITEEGNGHAHPVPARAETEVMAAVGTGNVPPPKVAPPPPPPHQPVIAQHVLRQNHRGAASSIGLLERPKGPPILPKVDIDPRKFHTIMHTMGPQDSTESADSTYNHGQQSHHHQRPIRPIRSRGTAQSHYSTTTLPPPQRALLATMSSTESESAMSARSAPTPISDPDRLLRARTISQEQQGPSFEIYQPMYPENQLEKPEILVEEPTDQEQSGSARDDDDPDDPDSDSPQLQVNLISPPAEESESSTAVLDSEGVPAPPPEFSGAAPLSVSDDEAKEQATDVEEDSQSCHLSKHQISKSEQALLNQQSRSVTAEESPETAAPINIIVTDDISDIVLAHTNDNVETFEPLEVNGVSLPSIGGASCTEDDIGVLSELPCAAAAAIAHMTGSTTADIQSSDKADFTSVSAPITGSQANSLAENNDTKETEEVQEIMDEELVVSEEEEASSKVIKIADLYVKIEHGEGSGSTISDEGNTGSDTVPVPFIDDDECKSEMIEEKAVNLPDLEVVSLPIHQHAEAIFIPPTPPTSNLSTKSEEISEGDVVEEATAEAATVSTTSEAVHPDASQQPQPPSPEIQTTASPIPEPEVPIDSSIYPENQLSDDENDYVKMHKPENKSEISDDFVLSELPCSAAAAIAHMIGSRQSSEPVKEESIEVSNGEQPKVIHAAGASVGGFIGRLPSLPTNSSTTTMSSIDLDIPPPPSHCDLKDSAQPSIESTSSTTVSPPPPPPMLLDGTEGSGPPTAVPCPPPDTEAFPFPPRALSRISEGGSTITSQITNVGGNGTDEDGANGKPIYEANELLICSGSGSEGGPDTMTDQNCTTSEDADNNPPSLNSDLPENLGRGGGGSVMRAIAEIEARAQQQLLMQGDDQPQPQRVDSKDLPSPPSSMINTTTEEVTQEGKTEMTLVDSLYLELSPAPQQTSTQWENCSLFSLFTSPYFFCPLTSSVKTFNRSLSFEALAKVSESD
jgi:hypothetical protein